METYREQRQRDMALRNLSEKTQVMYHAAARDRKRMSDMRSRKKAAQSLTENRIDFRNDILLPKSPFSCIVVTNRGLRVRSESPNFSAITPATVFKPLIQHSAQF